jgi:prepilin-type N-terminal cleavage/methylation domain-containing protein
MGRRQFAHRRSGFTLVEVLIVTAVIGVILVLAAPSFRDLIEMRRLRGTHAQVVTDVQFARSEAVSRQQLVVMRIGVRSAAPAGTCYVIYTCNDPAFNCDCECGRGAGSACTASTDWTEIRTVDVATSTGVTVTPQLDLMPPTTITDLQIRFDPKTGGSQHHVAMFGTVELDSNSAGNVNSTLTRLTRTLRTKVNLSGRPSECSPSSARVADTPVCVP